MNLYEETHSNLLARLTREAHEANTSTKQFIAIANAISDIIFTSKRHHNFGCLKRIIYMATLQLGYYIGPLNAKKAEMLLAINNIISPSPAPLWARTFNNILQTID